MTVKDLINALKEYPEDSEVITGIHNGHTNTYGVVDHLLKFNPWSDLYGTPGKVDKRLPDEECIYLASEFPYKHGVGSAPENTPIELVNGPEGDKDLIWKLNNFTLDEGGCWRKQLPEGCIVYNTKNKELFIHNTIENKHYALATPGIIDLREGLRLCNINYNVMS